jgi:hypothetical protein
MISLGELPTMLVLKIYDLLEKNEKFDMKPFFYSRGLSLLAI